MDLRLVPDLPVVDDVRQRLVQAGAGEGLARLVPPPPPLQLLDHRQQRAEVEVELEDGPHPLGLVRHHDQLPHRRVDVVAEHRPAAGPLPLPPGRRDLVPRPLADDLPLELGEGQQDVQTSRPMLVAVLNCWVTETNDTCFSSKVRIIRAKSSRLRQPVDLVDDHAVDLAGLDVGHQASEGRPVDVAAGEPAVVVAVGQAGPALAGLAADVGLARLALGVEGVELLLQPLLGALAGVDRTADGRGLGGGWQERFRALHAAPPFGISLKNR